MRGHNRQTRHCVGITSAGTALAFSQNHEVVPDMLSVALNTEVPLVVHRQGKLGGQEEGVPVVLQHFGCHSEEKNITSGRCNQAAII